jgi:hypothetical protein
LRYGELSNFGYAGEKSLPNILSPAIAGFSGNVFIGLYGLLFSAGKSIFLFNPFIVLFFVTYRKFFIERKKIFWLLTAFSLIVLFITAKWWAWYGGLCWGPRLLIPIIPLLYVIIGYGFCGFWKKNFYNKIIASFLFLASFGVQLLGIIVNPFKDYMVILKQDIVFEPLIWFTPQHSPIFSHWQYISKKDFGLLFFSRDNKLMILIVLISLLIICLIRILFLAKNKKLIIESTNVINT